MIMPPSSSMFTCVTRPLSSLQRPVSSKPNASAIQSAARPTSSYENIGTTRCSATRAHFCQLLGSLVEGGGMQIHICFGRRRRHERHVVEGRQEDAAVECVEMDQPVELCVAPRSCLTAAPWAFRAEEILDPAAEARDVPRQAVPVDRTGDSCLEPLAKRDHVRERL